MFVSHHVQYNDRSPDLCVQTLCRRKSERKAGLERIRKSAVIPDYVIPLDVDEICGDLLLFYRGLLLYLELWRKSAKHNGC